MDERRGERKGEYRYSSLVKLKKRGENYAVFYFAAKRFCFYIYEVFTSPEKEKRPRLYYSQGQGIRIGHQDTAAVVLTNVKHEPNLAMERDTWKPRLAVQSVPCPLETCPRTR